MRQDAGARLCGKVRLLAVLVYVFLCVVACAIWSAGGGGFGNDDSAPVSRETLAGTPEASDAPSAMVSGSAKKEGK